jgi:hypothetical protein
MAMVVAAQNLLRSKNGATPRPFDWRGPPAKKASEKQNGKAKR